jgi:hypothetical protein
MTDFVALAPAIVPHIEGKFADLPAELQALWKERIALFQWDELSAGQRVELAKQQDYEHDPATEPAREAMWVLMTERDDVQRQIDDLERVRAESVTEVIAKVDRLKSLKATLTALDDKFCTWRGDHPDAPVDVVAQDAPIDQREKKALLMIIGALVEIATGKAPGLPPGGVFDTQDALLRFITEKYQGYYGVSTRNLQTKFAAANKLLTEL